MNILFIVALAFAQMKDFMVIHHPGTGAPDFMVENEKVVGGFHYELLQLLSEKLGIKVNYIFVPRRRVTEYLQNGKANVRCVANPTWINAKDEFHWLGPIFIDRVVFLAKRGLISELEIKNVENLIKEKKLNIGRIGGYTYQPELEKLFNEKNVVPVYSRTMDQQVRMMKAGRIDISIGNRRSYEHLLSKYSIQGLFEIGPSLKESDSFCVFSKKAYSKDDFGRISKAFDDIKHNGKLKELQARFNLAPKA